MPTNPESEDLFLAGKNLSAEARAVTTEAVNAVKDWVNQRLDTITTQAKAELEESRKQLENQKADVTAGLDKTAAALDKIKSDLEKVDFKFGDSHVKSIENLRAATKAAQSELEDLKKRFHQGGELAGKSLVKAIASLV